MRSTGWSGSPPIFYAYYYIATTLQGRHLASEPLPSFGSLALQFTASIVIQEIIQYPAHTLLHLPAMYKRYHQQHYNFPAMIAISGKCFWHIVTTTLHALNLNFVCSYQPFIRIR